MSNTITARVSPAVRTALSDYARSQGLSRSEAMSNILHVGLEAVGYRPVAQQNQSQSSGAAAGRWGRETARAIGAALGWRRVSSHGNEFERGDGATVTLKTAKAGKASVGVYDSVRDRVDFILAAFEETDGGGSFSIYTVTPDQWRENATQASRNNPNRGKITFLTRSKFRALDPHPETIEV